MGRRENAVAAGTRQSEALALWLRAQRERKGVTYAAMAKLTGDRFTASTLSRGASGRVPSRRLTLALAAACDADSREAMRLRKAARRAEEERRRRAGASPEFRDLAVSLRSVMTHPDLIDSFAKLHEVMVEMRAREGQPSLSDLQTAAGRTSDGRRHRLPRSSLSVILRGEAVPSRAHLTAFMEALNASPGNVRRWQQVWDRLADTAAQRSSVAITIKVVGALPAGEPGGHPGPGRRQHHGPRIPPRPGSAGDRAPQRAGHSAGSPACLPLSRIHPFRSAHQGTTPLCPLAPVTCAARQPNGQAHHAAAPADAFRPPHDDQPLASGRPGAPPAGAHRTTGPPWADSPHGEALVPRQADAGLTPLAELLTPRTRLSCHRSCR